MFASTTNTPQGEVTKHGGPIPLQDGVARPMTWTASPLWLLVILGGLLAPVWTVRYPILVDYPNHLASAFVLAHLKDATFHFSQFYASDWNAYPYLTMDVILVALQRIMPVEVAGRVLLTICVLSVPAAGFVFVRRANPGEESLALWSLLIAQNLYFFLWGMLNLQLSLALCLLVLGSWLGYLERPKAGTWCLLLLLTTALYFTHIMGFGMAGWVMTTYAILARRSFRDLVFSWILFVPGALFFVHSTLSPARAWAPAFDLSAKWAGLLEFAVSGISPQSDFLATAIVAGALFVALTNNQDLKWNFRWLGVMGSLFAMYWIWPATFAPGIADSADRRLIPFIFVFALAAVKVGRRSRMIAVLAVLVFAMRAGVLEYRSLSAQREYTALTRAFEVIPKGMRVLPVGTPSEPMQHIWAYGVIQRGWVSPCLFQHLGVQPLRSRIQNDSLCEPVVNFSAPFQWAGIREDYDYVWVYRVPEAFPSLAAIGKVVYAEGDLRIFRIH
ncbi:MAG: hypothetical protein LAO19_22145 [Acidobacteriia bacterium]|nr:hypothetical protein [Terriglobia bacterium]